MSSQSLSLTEALRQDQQERWRRGERILVESYVQRHPALSSDTPALLDLIESEISLREERGELPQPEEYFVRFASLRTPLSALLSRRQRATPSGQTDGIATGITKAIKCPFCTTDLRGPLFDVQGKCDHCGREIKLLDDTISVPFKAGRTLGSFELVRRVGRGTFGEVWLARDTVLQRDVAIKVPRGVEQDQGAVDRFLREARAAAKLQHPNLVSVYETGYFDDVPYIATAFIAGTNLQDLIDRRKLSLEAAAKMMQTIAAAVAHAHAAGILHRDLKPANVLVDASGVPHVADFGLAKNLFSADATLTFDGQIVGTPAYMPPEQTRAGGRDITAASDVYALGVMLYESITHQRPFTGELESVFHQIRSEEPTPPRKLNPAISRDLETICLKAMSKRPEDRYASAQDLADDLGRYLRGELIQGKRPGLARRMSRRLRAVSPALVVVAVVCVLAGIVLGLNGLPNPPENPPLPNQPELPPLVTGKPEPPSDDWQYDVLIDTDPPGAKVVLYQLDYDTLRPDFALRHEPEGFTPIRYRLSSGQYLVVAFDKEGNFHEVVRSVPHSPGGEVWSVYAHEAWTWHRENETLEWKPIKLFPKELPGEELVRSQGGVFLLEAPGAIEQAQRWRIPPFDLQATEVTANRARGRSKAFNDGQPANYPAVQMSWDEAMVWAEAWGMRLPDLVEAEFLANTTRKPGDDPVRMDADWKRPVKDAKADVLQTDPPLLGIDSGALEWTQNRSHVKPPNDAGRGHRYILRGGPMAALKEPLLDHAGRWASVNQHMAGANFSVRCARSPGPRLKAEDFLQRLP